LKWANAGTNEIPDIPVNLLNAKIATADGKATYSVAQHLSWSTYYAEQAATGVAGLQAVLEQVTGIGSAVAQVADKVGAVHKVVSQVQAATNPAPGAASVGASTVDSASQPAPAWPTADPAPDGQHPVQPAAPTVAVATSTKQPLVTGYLVSWIRTVVPSLWGTVIGFAISLGVIPTGMVGEARDIGTAVLVPICISAFYAVARWLETRTWAPRKLVQALLGSANPPQYRASAPAVPSNDQSAVAPAAA
jgi:hypothetical protein